MSFIAKIKNKILSNYSIMERRKFLFVYLLIAFPVIQMAIFWFYVNISGIALAFQDAEGNWSLDSFKHVIQGFTSKSDINGFNLGEML